LLEKVQVLNDWIAVFPFLLQLKFYTPANEDNVIDLTQQFIEGVAFMHQQSIAHLDLKPDNILVNDRNRLWITDFSASVQVRDADETIEGYIGTPGWMTPEVGEERQYSPIRADLWSCGQMIQYFTTFGPGFKEPVLEKRSQLLLDQNPSKRPSLKDVSQSRDKKRTRAVEVPGRRQRKRGKMAEKSGVEQKLVCAGVVERVGAVW
jgi:serine/threonine protein kinase